MSGQTVPALSALANLIPAPPYRTSKGWMNQ